jgi:hypothetical protein
MSTYHKYSFISAEPLYALVKEELKSYFDTGAVDDILFPKWTDTVLRKLGKSSYKVKDDFLYIEDYCSKLPADFLSVKEAWGCTSLTATYTLPSALYESTTRNITPTYSVCDSVCDPCLPELITVTYKTTADAIYEYSVSSLLKPGNISARKQCSYDCINIHSTCPDQFDIRDNQFITNFSTGSVYLVYYSETIDSEGNQLIPEDIEFQEAIEYYLKWKIFEQLCNQLTDETYNQIDRKKQEYKQMYDEKLIIAKSHSKKETVYRKIQKMKRISQRFKYYQID